MQGLKSRFLVAFGTIALLATLGLSAVIRVTLVGRAAGVVINLAGAQRMLSQKMTNDALLIRQGQGKPAMLRESMARFDRVLRALTVGDPELGIPADDDPVIAGKAGAVAEVWGPFREALERLLAGQASDAEWRTIADGNGVLLERMNAMVLALEQRNTAGVNRMLWLQGAVLGALLVVIGLCWLLIVSPLVRRLLFTTQQLHQGAKYVAAAAEQVSGSSHALADGTVRQAAAIHETSASTAQMDTTGKKNAEHTRAAAALVQQTSAHFQETLASLDKMVRAMEGISVASSGISKVIRVIDEIAFQTNLLALNAAVEAARAGESGLGFAVVADEVRTLARRCAQAAQETTGLIEEAVARAAEGRGSVDAVAGSVRAMASESNQLTEILGEMDRWIQQESAGIHQTLAAIQQVEQVTNANAAASEEAAAAAVELQAQSATLRQTAMDLSAVVKG